uniref:ATP synthase subunit a n=1 Tax=Nipponacmea fuscoviridis TaxID=225302 RepID=A0A6B9Q9H1_9GAST|nr:ATP synthase F0 subunit 6 [Nipponacmea fuscoviridis]QHE50286.1 ATP synthase F0 subunit 6 [Nipponacmea fuscoviridis]QVH34239.1 ATP synthase F0 subunit 6 [Nipponacmea fuscoviridis]
MPLLGWAWGEAESKVKESSTALLFISGCTWVTMLILWQSVPGVFVSISHLSVTASVALPFWSAMVLTSGLTCTNDLMASLVPEGTPGYLILFMVVVEVFSHFMRPLALCMRLSLTMMAGHILLGLILSNLAELLFDTMGWHEAVESYEFLKELGWSEGVISGFTSSSVALFSGLAWVGISVAVTLGELAVGMLQAYIFFTLLLFFNTQYPRV